jgi:hypothetical protein
MLVLKCGMLSREKYWVPDEKILYVSEPKWLVARRVALAMLREPLKNFPIHSSVG